MAFSAIEIILTIELLSLTTGTKDGHFVVIILKYILMIGSKKTTQPGVTFINLD